MENTNNSLAHRQLDVIRKNLLAVFRFAVKALIDKACFCSIDDGCEEFINFCAAMEHILQHRLRPSKAWYLGDDRSHFWFYIKTACHRQDLRGCITNIDNIENIKSPVAKGRAFVRCALMEKRLSEYLGEALKQTHITRRFYKSGAIMLGEEATELCGTLLGLNSIDFGFCIKGENYDTVECPLAINYTPFMKFRQSQESLHSDLEEMRELSCGSSLASEDGTDVQDTPPSDTWPDRYNLLHKRYMRVLEQKSFLEEVTASQEKALQAAAAAQQEVGRLQRDAAFQKHQYEGVILELQAQVTRMKRIHETLQQQLMAARGARFPMTEMERRREKGGEATRFAAAMGHKLDSDRQSLTSSYDRSSLGRPAGDTRSLASALSEISVDAVGQGQTTHRPGGEDSQSMVPLTGSLGDLHLDLEPGTTAMSETSSVVVVNPEQATPVVSVSSGVYASGFEEEEVNGNGGGQGRVTVTEAALRNALSVQVSQSEERAGDHVAEYVHLPHEGRNASEASPALLEAAQTESDASSSSSSSCFSGSTDHHGDVVSTEAREDPRATQESANLEAAQSGAAMPQSYVVVGIPDSASSDRRPSESSGTVSEPEELVAEGSSGREEPSGDPDSQEAEVLGHMTSSGESALSSGDKDDGGSELEVLAREDDGEDPSVSAPPSLRDPDGEDASDPEILDGATTAAAATAAAISKQTEEGPAPPTHTANAPPGGAASPADRPPSDQGETSDPEVLTQEEGDAESSADDHERWGESQQHPESGQSRTASHSPQSQLLEPQSGGPSPTSDPAPPFQAGGDHSQVAGEAEKEGGGGGSDSGSSDENKDTWDMLSDANHDSSSS